MHRGKFGDGTEGTPHEREIAESWDEERESASSYCVWHNGQSASPPKCESASGKGRRLAFDKLRREILQHAARGVKRRETICRSIRRLEAMHRSCPGVIDNLDDLFDQFHAAQSDPDFGRLATILNKRLNPIIRHHFREDEQRVLQRALRRLIVLRILGLPYRSESPISLARANGLLASLHRLCNEDGLMVWRGAEGEPIYVVERDTDRFIDWLVTRMIAFLSQWERDKALSDALWTTLTLGKGARVEGVTFKVEMTPSTEGQAALICHQVLGKRVLVFESPWKEEQGYRVHRVVRRLPQDVDWAQIWVWLPASPEPEEDLYINRYAALARALRESGSQESNAIKSRLSQLYVASSASALRAIIRCYRQGEVITDRGTWRPDRRRESLVAAITQLVTWRVGEGAVAQDERQGAAGAIGI